MEQKQNSLRWIFFKNIIKQVTDSYRSKLLMAFDIISVFLMMLPFIESKYGNFLPLVALVINILGGGGIFWHVIRKKEYRRIDKPLRQFREHTYYINTIKLSITKRFLVSCGGDRIVIVWDFAAGKIHSRFKHDAWVGNVAFSRDETKIYSISGIGDLYEWDLLENKKIKSSRIHKEQTRGLDISYTVNKIVTSGEDGRIVIDDLSLSDRHFEKKVSEVEIRKVVFNHNGSLIAYGNNDGVISVMDLIDFSTRELFHSPKNEMIRSVQFNHADTFLAATDSGGFVSMIDIKNGGTYQIKCHNGHAICCDFSDDDAFIATGGQDNLIKVWKITDGNLKKVFEIHGHANSVTDVIFNSSEDKLISAGRDEVICEWNIRGLSRL